MILLCSKPSITFVPFPPTHFAFIHPTTEPKKYDCVEGEALQSCIPASGWNSLSLGHDLEQQPKISGSTFS